MREKKTVATQAQLAAALGRSASWVRDKLSLGMPGTPGRYVVDDCREWLRLHEGERAKAKKEEDDDDPSLDGGDSPALERYRLARAKQEELKLARMQGELVEVEHVRDFFQKFAGLLRGFGEKLAKECPLLCAELESTLYQAGDLAEEIAGGSGEPEAG